VAKINPVKLKQDAEKEERSGRFEKAIELLKQLVQENPRDWNTINRIGDLYVKLNNVKAANEQYARVAEFYSKDGFYLKAIAVWKKINKNDPTQFDAYLNLADLYAKQGLLVEAKGQFQIVIDEYVKRNKIREAGEALRRLAEIDPADLKVRIRLAELYSREGRGEKAAEEYVAIADELVKKGHLAEALQVLDKGRKIAPPTRASRPKSAGCISSRRTTRGRCSTSRRPAGPPLPTGMSRFGWRKRTWAPGAPARPTLSSRSSCSPTPATRKPGCSSAASP